MLRSFSSARPRMKKVLNWLSSSSSSSFGCWVTAHRPTLNLRPSRATRGKTLDSRSLLAAEHPLGLLEGDGHDRHALVAVGVVEVGRLPLLEDPAGQVGGHQHLLGGAQAAHVDEHHLAGEQVAHDRAADRDAGSVATHGSSTMRRARRWTTCRVLRATRPDELDVPEPGQVLDPGELGQPGRARRRRSGARARRAPPPGAGSSRRRCADRRRSARPG